MQQTWPIFEKIYQRQWKMDGLQQCGTEKILGKMKSWSAFKEVDVIYLIGLERHCVLQAPSEK